MYLSVFLDASLKAEIGHVDHGCKSAFCCQVGDGLPLPGFGTDTTGVVATGMEHHNVARTPLAQGIHHGIEPECTVVAVEVGVRFRFQAGSRADRVVVGPGGVAEPYGGVRFDGLDQVGADPQRAGPARCLHGSHAVFGQHRAVFAEYQLSNGAVEALDARRPQVGLGGLGAVQDLLGPFHALENGCIAVLVAINTDSQVDFFRVGVRRVCGDDAQDRIGRNGIDVVEHSGGFPGEIE